MPLVNVLVNGRAYTVACDEGEEQHLRELAAFLDGRVRQLVESVGQAGDARLLLMAALVITDELADALNRLDERDRQLAELKSERGESKNAQLSAEDTVAEALEIATRHIEDIAARLGPA